MALDTHHREGRLIRFRLSALLEERGWTAYRLAQETGLSLTRAYNLAAPGKEFAHFKTDTLDRLCEALGVQPGALLEWVPDKPVRRGGAKGSA